MSKLQEMLDRAESSVQSYTDRALCGSGVDRERASQWALIATELRAQRKKELELR